MTGLRSRRGADLGQGVYHVCFRELGHSKYLDIKGSDAERLAASRKCQKTRHYSEHHDSSIYLTSASAGGDGDLYYASATDVYVVASGILEPERDFKAHVTHLSVNACCSAFSRRNGFYRMGSWSYVVDLSRPNRGPRTEWGHLRTRGVFPVCYKSSVE